MAEPEISWGRYDQAYRAIWNAFQDVMRIPFGKKVSKYVFTWNPDGTLATLKAYDGDELLFTVSFTWNVDGTLGEVART